MFDCGVVVNLRDSDVLGGSLCVSLGRTVGRKDHRPVFCLQQGLRGAVSVEVSLFQRNCMHLADLFLNSGWPVQNSGQVQ